MSAFFASFLANPLGIFINIAAIVFVFGLIIFVHEFGHFLVAKRIGVRVEQFSFGFGHEIFGFQWGETRYTLNWIPLGGFVRMSGETPDDYTGPKFEGASTAADNRDRSRDFMAQPWYKRIWVALAGPTMNYILAAIIFFSMLMIWGEPTNQINMTEIGVVVGGKPADQAGLQPGDVVLTIQDQPVENFSQVKDAIRVNLDKPIKIEIKRKESVLSLRVTPEKDPGNPKEGIIGIRPAKPIFEHQKIGVLRATKKSLQQCWNMSYFTVYYLAHTIKNRIKPDVAGPVGITKAIVDSVKSGPEEYFYLIAMISLAIGLFNLFPIPMLDGSHVVYYTIEGIRKRPISAKTMNRINIVGFTLLMALMVFATMNDIQRVSAERKAKAVDLKK